MTATDTADRHRDDLDHRSERRRLAACSARSASTSWRRTPSAPACPTYEEQKAYLAAAAEAGLAGVPFAAEYGGGGLTLAHEKIWREVKGNYTMMDGEFIISQGMCLPILNEYGTPEQKRGSSPTTSRAARCGARCSPSPAPAPTSPACRPRPNSTVTNG